MSSQSGAAITPPASMVQKEVVLKKESDKKEIVKEVKKVEKKEETQAP